MAILHKWARGSIPGVLLASGAVIAIGGCGGGAGAAHEGDAVASAGTDGATSGGGTGGHGSGGSGGGVAGAGGVPSVVVDGGPRDNGAVATGGDALVPAGDTAYSLDILMVVQNSKSMGAQQQALASAIGRLFDSLRAFPRGLPDLHVGVVNTDLGGGPQIDPTWRACARVLGDKGALQVVSGCGLGQDSYVSSSNGGINNNFTGLLEDVVGCMVKLGTSGCGYERHLQAAKYALRPDSVNAGSGFLRGDAYLLLIIVGDQDDCSAMETSNIYGRNEGVGSGFAEERRFGGCVLTSYNCSGNSLLMLPFGTFDYPFSSCWQAPFDNESILPVESLVADIKAVKARPEQVLVAVVGGWPSEPATARFQAVRNPAPASSFGTSYLAPAPICMSPAGGAGAGWRLKAFADGFGVNGLFDTICAGTLDSSMTKIAGMVRRVMAK